MRIRYLKEVLGEQLLELVVIYGCFYLSLMLYLLALCLGKLKYAIQEMNFYLLANFPTNCLMDLMLQSWGNSWWYIILFILFFSGALYIILSDLLFFFLSSSELDEASYTVNERQRGFGGLSFQSSKRSDYTSPPPNRSEVAVSYSHGSSGRWDGRLNNRDGDLQSNRETNTQGLSFKANKNRKCLSIWCSIY